MPNTTKDTDDTTMSDGGDEENVTKDVKEQSNDESTPMEQVPRPFCYLSDAFVLFYFLGVLISYVNPIHAPCAIYLTFFLKFSFAIYIYVFFFFLFVVAGTVEYCCSYYLVAHQLAFNDGYPVVLICRHF